MVGRHDPAEVLHRPEPDIREVAAAEPAQTKEDDLRQPSAEEVAGYVTNAQRTLAELDARSAYDRQREQEDRAAELARWHHDDQYTDADHAISADDVGGVLDDHEAGSVRHQPSAFAYQD